MKLIKLISMLALLAITQGCSITESQVSVKPQNMYLDEHFETDETIVPQQELFQITPAMREYVEKRLLHIANPGMQAKTLIKDLFSPDYMNIRYVHDANFTPAETFESGLANCMSLTMLAYVLVNETELKARFMNVEVEENWNVSRQFTQLNGHVNLEVEEPRSNSHVVYFYGKVFTIDFLPMLHTKAKSKRTLTKEQITALFYNNKGADALADYNHSLAYQYFKAASQLAPDLVSVWGNLASLYRQTGHIKEAEELYTYAIAMAPDNLNIQENLALLYRKTGRHSQADKLYSRVERARKNNPYYYSMLAEQALFRNEPEQAMSLYRKAIRLQRKEHTFYFGLAKTAMLMNQLEDAEKYLQRAKDLAKGAREKQKYESKISALASLVVKAY